MYLINFQIISDSGEIYISGELPIVDFLGALGISGPGEVGIIDNIIVSLMRKNGARGGVIIANYFNNNHTPFVVHLFCQH